MTLADQKARDQIRTATGSTLFVNAGAGSGKTTALVARVTQLVAEDAVRLRHIAAVTFTEKAGAELRDRLRAEFERIRRHDKQRRDTADQALDDLDAAAIGTLHSFAQRILAEHPIEAGLPPIIEVLDEVGSSVAFDERWSEVQSALLDDDEIARPLLAMLQVGGTMKQLRSLTIALGNDWDLIEDRILHQPSTAFHLPDLDRIAQMAAEVVQYIGHCTDPQDKLVAHLRLVEVLLNAYRSAPDEAARLGVVHQLSLMKWGGKGKASAWKGRPKVEVVAKAEAMTAEAATVVGGVLDQCLRLVTRWLAQRVLDSAETRRREGRLEFHDLLVLVRNLLRRNADVRALVHEDYQRVLLDEFQDTDPIQIEMAARICGGAGADQAAWQDIGIPPGRLFVVGDAKQSIYRFRRADIATYLQTSDHLGNPVELTTNFRSVTPVLDWINGVFSAVIQAEPNAQPNYVPLDTARDDVGDGPAVSVLGATAHADNPRADGLRERESEDVAAAVRQALDRPWTVYDRRAGEWRPARAGDIAILVPARTSLPFLESALDAAGVPYRAEASSLVYHAQEVRALLACARAIADPSDALALVTALRTPLFGCGDDDLWRWRNAGGRFSIYSELEGPLAEGPVGTALAYLSSLARQSRWLSPSEVLGRIVTDRRMLEVAVTGERARDQWRRLRFVVDQARAWSEAAGGGLRAYLAWAAHQGQEVTRVAEAVLPETDADAVRVMTVHAAKGLEFPIVILSGLTSQLRGGKGVRLLWPAEGGYAVRLAGSLQTGDFDAASPVDEQLDGYERLRLLYVAATRARDHLVVSLHRPVDGGGTTAAKILAAGGAAALAPPLELAHDAGVPLPAVVPAAPPPLADVLARVETAHAATLRPAAVSASGLEGTEPAATPDGLAKGARDLELPPWSKGRYGSAVGRAVHAVLQTVDLVTGAGLDAAVEAQAMAEGLSGRENLIRSLVGSALASELVQRAAARRHWRETYVGTTQDDDTVLEGYVDLVFREDDGSLVIVDYKTDAIPAGALDSRVAYYKPQMDAYVTALTAATGARVSARLLFLNPAGSVTV